MSESRSGVRDKASERQARVPLARGRLTALAWASFLPLVVLWRSLTQEVEEQPRAPRHQEVRLPLPEGLTVAGPVAIWREGAALRAVSLRCSHLGCRLRASGDEGLVCPCHGSLFDARGRPRRGPAREPLQALAFRIDREREALVVDLPS